MSPTVLAADPCSGGSAGFAGGNCPDMGVSCPGEGRQRSDFGFALRTRIRSAANPDEDRDFDRLIKAMHRHSQDTDSLRRAAGAIRHTVEMSLWQGLRSGNSRLPSILSEAMGKAAGVYLLGRLRGFAITLQEWLVMVSSPRRLLWAVQAAWRGDEIVEHVGEKAGWHSVDEIAVFQRESDTPLIRVGEKTAPGEEDWLASNPVFAVSRRYLAGHLPADETAASPPCGNGPAARTMVVVGGRAGITARVTGHPPPRLQHDLQSLCQAADDILADTEAGRAEWVFRLKQLVTPALTKIEPEVARRFWHPVVILTVFLMAGALLLGSAGVEHLRWEGVVRQIDAEPGIEVISSSATWGHRRIEVLRDPRARPVSVLFLERALDPAAVSIHERPFCSADARLSAAHMPSRDEGRQSSLSEVGPAAAKGDESPAASGEWRDEMRLDLLRSVLDLPGDIEMKLSSGELTVRGSLAEPAYSRLAGMPKKMTWIKKLHLDQLRDVTAENIAGIRSDLESTNVEFVPASAMLPEASRLRLRSIASQMKLLAEEARLKRHKVEVRLRAAHPGLDDGTVSLRMEAVRRDLIRQGVLAVCFDVEAGVLDAPGPQTVAFRIHLESQAPEP